MVNIICEISKYLTILFMLLYTVKCFSVMSTADEDSKRVKLNLQVFYMFMIHGLSYMILYLRIKDKKILIFYMIQLLVAIFYMIIYHVIYREASRLLTNNCTFLLLIGYTMITRLDFDLATRQFMLATIGLLVTALMPAILLRTKNLKNHGVWFGVGGLFLLITVFIPGLGYSIYGSRNWIRIGSLSLQPMEFVKIIFVFFVASMLYKVNTFGDLVVNAIISAAFMGILVLEKDLGAAVIFYVTYVCMVYLATSRISLFIGGISLGVGAVMGMYALFKDSFFAHVATRVAAWKDPFMYIDTGGYQVSQSLFALGTGGFTGSGLMRGQADTIPVSESDFIFSAMCEEMGVLFGLALILVFLSIFISFINISMKCRNPFYKYVSYGFATIFIIQALLNIGGVTKFIPSTGVTLPLVSYGVSSVISTLIMFAVMQTICIINSNEVMKYEKEKERLSSNSDDGRRIRSKREREEAEEQ